MTLADAVLNFLAEHRGETFCSQCLAMKLKGTHALTSSALFEAEGRGARRAYDVCSVCGNERLVASRPPLDDGPVA